MIDFQHNIYIVVSILYLIMLIELYIIFQILVVGLFFTAFFTKNEIIWVITMVISGTMMYTSYNVEYYTYVFNGTISAYSPVITTHSYPYLMGINLIFCSLALLLGLFDMFDKYGSSLFSRFRRKHE